MSVPLTSSQDMVGAATWPSTHMNRVCLPSFPYAGVEAERQPGALSQGDLSRLAGAENP